MNQVQYRLLLENRRTCGPAPLGEPGARARRWQRRTGGTVRAPIAAVLARAAKELRRREAADAAWQSVARPEWIPSTRVVGLELLEGGGYRVLIAADGATVGYELRRCRLAIERQMARLVAGLRRVRIVVGGAAGADSDGAGGGE
jgi:hypothetical protein